MITENRSGGDAVVVVGVIVVAGVAAIIDVVNVVGVTVVRRAQPPVVGGTLQRATQQTVKTVILHLVIV